MTAPPSIRTSEPGSFAHDTLARRVPQILDDTRRNNEPVPPDVGARLDALRAELVGGRMRGLVEAAPDREAWDTACAPNLGLPWLNLPWFFAEAFFYRRLLEATGYFQPGPLRDVDPFAPEKRAEWKPEAAPAHAGKVLRELPASGLERLQAALRASLWGNRTDLSYNVAATLGREGGGSADDEQFLLVDDSALLINSLEGVARVGVIADNAGTELLMDLVLIDALAQHGVALIDLHVKAHPFFVSDTTARDVTDAVTALKKSGDKEAAALGSRISSLLAVGLLTVETHPFWTSSGFFDALPHGLCEGLASSDLIVVKGDANYRRLAGDARWPHETPFHDVVSAFPAPLVALRTLKSEVIVGLPRGLEEKLDWEDPEWRVNGRRGVIQAWL